MDTDEYAAVESSYEDEQRAALLEEMAWAEYEEARARDEWETEQREREAMFDPTSDFYYSDGAAEMRRDAGC